ncbi:MAG TPA: alkaline phosphatase family protein [Candidatus Eremiobacteraceae bacterium]|nr:alkaline phosphatase family protein [Candidatus Eremiobacteraceae bacterium]
MHSRFVLAATAAVAATIAAVGSAAEAYSVLPDGRMVTPIGFTIPVEGFASSEAMSPDGRWIAVLSQDGGAIDVIATGEDARQVDRLAAPWATGMIWTADGLYVTRGYTGLVSRFSYDAAGSQDTPKFSKRPDVHVGGLVNGIDEDPISHQFVVARTGEREVDLVNDRTGVVKLRLHTTGQPFALAVSGATLIVTLYDSDHVDAFPYGVTVPIKIPTGPHPTALLIDRDRAFVADADGHDVAQIDVPSRKVVRHIDLSLAADPFAGQTPSGMAVSANRKTLFVAESGFNDVAVVDLSNGAVAGRIPTGWYPMGVLYRGASTIDDDPRSKSQLWILSAQGLGTQPDPGSEWNGWYTGFVQHIIVEPAQFKAWSDTVASDNHFAIAAPPATQIPPIKHVVFIVQENKHFDEVFGDEPQADVDPALLLFGRKFTPNAHALAERYTLFDNFMGNGQASIYGHAWATQGMTNDYHVRNAHTPDDAATPKDKRVAWSIWPYAVAGEDTVTVAQMDFDWFKDLADLPKGPRVNVSAVFGPRGQLVDELQRKGVSYRVYGEQLTMVSDGHIAPGLAGHADHAYPGAHINFAVLDTQRAKLFLDDVNAHGLAAYSYVTLPTDHTAGTKPGFYTPASYVGNNDLALGQIIEGLSKRPEWRDTVVFVTTDDPQGSGDHVDSHRQPAFAIGPFVRQGFVDHTRYSIPSILRTVEVLDGLDPLNMYDAEAAPMLDAFSAQPVAAPFTALPSNIPMVKNPGKAKSMAFELDGPDSAAIPAQEWRSIRGWPSLVAHDAYLRRIGKVVVARNDDP